MTKFLDDHPGGDEVILTATGNILCLSTLLTDLSWFLSSCFALSDKVYVYKEKPLFHGHYYSFGFHFSGKDATDDFEDVGHSSTAKAMLDEYYVGDIDSATVPTKTKCVVPPKQDEANQDKSSDLVIKILQFLVPLLILGLALGIRFYTKTPS